MSDIVQLVAEKREVTGKKVRTLRNKGYVPATIYQNGKESVNVSIAYQPFVKVFAAVGMGQPVEITIGKETRLAMIKDVHMDPAKNTVMHAAFHAVRADRVVEAEIPVHIEGNVPAEAKGNFVVRPHDHVLVKAIPSKLPEVFNVDAALLQDAGDTITVADIKPVAGVEIISEPEMQLAVAEEPRVVEEPEEDEAVDAADVPSENGGNDSKDDSSEEKS